MIPDRGNFRIWLFVIAFILSGCASVENGIKPGGLDDGTQWIEHKSAYGFSIRYPNSWKFFDYLENDYFQIFNYDPEEVEKLDPDNLIKIETLVFQDIDHPSSGMTGVVEQAEARSKNPKTQSLEIDGKKAFKWVEENEQGGGQWEFNEAVVIYLRDGKRGAIFNCCLNKETQEIYRIVKTFKFTDGRK